MELENTQILNDTTTDNNEESTQVGVLIVGSTRHPVIKGSTKIGRNPALCKIVLNDTTVSKVHAEIQAGCEAAFLSDVRSVNGTKIKDVALKPFFYYTINNGDEIYLGAVKATFKTSKSSEHNASIVPETPASSGRHAVQNTPGECTGNASDCLFNNTSAYQSDDSVVSGTQRKEMKAATFQQPLVPINRRRADSGSSVNAIPPAASGKSRRSNQATTPQGADLHDLETQQLDSRPNLGQSRVAKKLQLEQAEENVADADIYDAETQILPLAAESEGAADAERAKQVGTIDAAGSSSRRINSNTNFSRELQISPSSSPPESPKSACENAAMEESQNLLELCETPLLLYEKKTGEKSATDNAGEAEKCETVVQNDASHAEEKANADASPIAVGNSGKSLPSSHVVAESDDDSATDDEVDIRIAGARRSDEKGGVATSGASDAIDDDSATDDEGKFESFALNSRSKKDERSRRKTVANIFEAETQRIDQEPPKAADAERRETAKDRDAEVNIFEAPTQRLIEESPDVVEAKKRRETAKDRDSLTNIFDAETQRLTEEPPDVVVAKKRRETAKDRDAEAKIFEAATQRLNEESPDIVDTKKRRETAKDRDADVNIFEAATQRLNEESPDVVVAKKRRETAKDRDAEAKIFEAATQRLDEESPDVVAKKRQETAKDRDAEVNIFEAATQRLDEDSPDIVDTKRRRETAKDRDAEENIFEAATQRLNEESPDVVVAKKRRETAKDRDAEVKIFEAVTQRLDEDSPDIVDTKRRRETAKDRDAEENIFEAATQRMDQEPLDVAGASKRRDPPVRTLYDAYLDLSGTPVPGVPITSTPLSRSRTFGSSNFDKSPRSETAHDLHLAPTQVITDEDDVVGGTERKDSVSDSPRVVAANQKKKRDNSAPHDAATPAPVTPSRARYLRRSGEDARSRVREDPATTRVTTDRDDTVDGNTRKITANPDSSAEHENTEGKKDNSANLDDSLARNLEKILDEEAANRETGDEPTQLLTQNLVDILMPTQRFDEETAEDVSEPPSPKRKKISSPATLGFVDGQAVADGRWTNTGPKANSTMRDREKEGEENARDPVGEHPLSECNDEDDILFGLPEVKICGTLSNPGSPCPSTASSHSDFAAPTLRGIGKSAKVEETVAVSSTESSDSRTTVEATKSLELDSPVVPKKSRLARRKVPRRLIEDEDRDPDEVFGYDDLKKIADSLLASSSVGSTRARKGDNEGTVEEHEALATRGRRQRRVGEIVPPNKRADSSRRARNLPRPPSSLLVSDAKSKRSVDESATADVESSSAGTSRNSSRLAKSTKAVAARAKATEPKRGEESQEIETILAASPKENVQAVSRTSYVKVQLTRLDTIDVDRKGSHSGSPVAPNASRKRRATMSLKDLTPASASPARANSRRTIAEGIDARLFPKEEHKILITGLTADYSKIVKKLGGTVVSEPSKATVLITDKVRRTYKFLCAVARGLRVVSINWLLQSSKADRFLDCDDFILKDTAAEKQYKFKLEKSLQTARTKKFLEGYTIVVTPKVNQPEIHELKGMVEACGGKVLARAPGARAWNAKTVIVSREEDRAAINLLLSKCPKTLKISVQSTEFILTGILRQEVNLLEHRLDIS